VAFRIDDRGHAQPFAADLQQPVAQRGIRTDHRQLIAGPHYVFHVQQQPTAEAAARMRAREVVLAETAGFEHCDREGVAHREGRGRAGSRCQIVRARLLGDADIQDGCGRLAERRLRTARHRDQRDAETLDDRQYGHELGGLAGVGDADDDVVGRQHADVAVAGLGRMQEKCGRAGARERRGDLVTDVPRLAHAGHGNSAGAVVQQAAGLDERRAEPVLQGRDGGDFGLQHASPARQQLVGIERGGGPWTGLHAANDSALS
jgi:hypothetical protein